MMIATFLKRMRRFVIRGFWWPTDYERLFSAMLTGFALCRMIFDDAGQPVDFVYVDINDAFCRMTGIERERIIGKRVTEAIPGIERFWIDRYGAVVKSGVADCFEGYVEALHQYYLVAAYRPFAGHFAVTFYKTGQIHKLQKELSHAYEQTIEGWARALDIRDHETAGHSIRVARMVEALAQACGYTNKEKLLHLRRGALLHDIGKIGVPDTILLKPGRLTWEELLVMQQHTTVARALLWPIEFLRPAIDVPYSHHEWYNGAGYPEKLRGEFIPITARMFTVVDVWDALRSNRPYRQAYTFEESLSMIVNGAGTQFDPDIVKVFVRFIDKYDGNGEGG